jgi:hypothetical protein
MRHRSRTWSRSWQRCGPVEGAWRGLWGRSLGLRFVSIRWPGTKRCGHIARTSAGLIVSARGKPRVKAIRGDSICGERAARFYRRAAPSPRASTAEDGGRTRRSDPQILIHTGTFERIEPRPVVIGESFSQGPLERDPRTLKPPTHLSIYFLRRGWGRTSPPCHDGWLIRWRCVSDEVPSHRI